MYIVIAKARVVPDGRMGVSRPKIRIRKLKLYAGSEA